MKTKLSGLLLAALLFAGVPLVSSSAYVAVSVGIAPPVIPVYEQPFCPAAGYIWTPGYWAYSDFGYYWVPGVWVAPPRVGWLWTPGYWAFTGGNYIFHDGYWGPTVGFYGGINYGYGYWGSGYYGGRWVGSTFSYNTAVTRVNTKVIHNTYVNRQVLSKKSGNRTSFNGKGGAQAKATAREQAAAKAEHAGPTSAQRSRVDAAKKDPALRAQNNKGKPKADAVRGFQRENQEAGASTGAKTAAKEGSKRAQPGNMENAAENRRHTTGNRTRAPDRQSTERGKAKTASAGERSRQITKSEQPKRKVESRRQATAPRVVQRPQASSHRPQTVRAPQGRQGPGPAAAQQNKKKKKHETEKPGG